MDEIMKGWDVPKSWIVVWISSTRRSTDTTTTMTTRHSGPNILNITEPQMQTERLRYVDILAASDLVILKTGYGVVSEVGQILSLSLQGLCVPLTPTSRSRKKKR